MHPTVFLDRDNTIIQNDGDLGDPAEVRMIQGAANAIASLQGLGYKIVVVTNQGGVARGQYAEADVDKVHDEIARRVAETAGASIDAFYYCPFHPAGSVPEYTKEHDWRKPNPGMLIQAAEDHGLALDQSWMIGDAPRDIEAGQAAGTGTILIGTDDSTGADFVAENLPEAARIIAQKGRPDPPPRPAKKSATKRTGTRTKKAKKASKKAQAKPKADLPATTPTVAAEMPAPVAAPPPPPSEQRRPADPAVLTAILEELRTLTQRRREYSLLRPAAVLAQFIAIVLILFAVLKAGQPDVTLAWIGGAIFTQVLVLTLLFFHNQS